MHIDQLIILTTATSRPGIHNLSFSSKNLRILDGIGCNIKWFINIDKTVVCPATQDKTKENLTRLLRSFDVTYILTEKSSHFNAYKNIMTLAEKHITDNTVIFNLEDDWVVNKQFRLRSIIDEYMTPYGV